MNEFMRRISCETPPLLHMKVSMESPDRSRSFSISLLVTGEYLQGNMPYMLGISLANYHSTLSLSTICLYNLHESCARKTRFSYLLGKTMPIGKLHIQHLYVLPLSSREVIYQLLVGSSSFYNGCRSTD